MKKYRKILSLMLCVIVLITTSSTIFASEQRNGINELKKSIKSLETYQMYESEIKSEYVFNETMTDEGYRIYISFNLTDINGEKVLMYVSDENLNILYSGLAMNSEDNIYLTDFENKTTETYEISDSRSGCFTESCTETRKRVSWDPEPGCNLIVGQACKSLVGLPIMMGICKAGVFVYCSFSLTNVCVKSVTLPFCEDY